ncbi:hypothetical protein TREMEDRAFT_60034 [Tremella mesenterica DSM 1558]|uniref:uncharacterized protein n=1 Tax=Tremella mesenterica (strain ATCC 24925 / CBS 8224 / DSM 1558 / NBRC 9311 / NRRL Y-6157 / RJB 2259-6 / UBC 559-6) TaxID=578456 RepID=UPI0003F494A5|nr:uncharacterized protein TREMEDRAFT_60034 [Tremella mesenterica DSM 1558]EIW71093.1 hypothetical protein TREMEDRAFT_60034 [Tremella mesenterica DSM 1558]
MTANPKILAIPPELTDPPQDQIHRFLTSLQPHVAQHAQQGQEHFQRNLCTSSEGFAPDHAQPQNTDWKNKWADPLLRPIQDHRAVNASPGPKTPRQVPGEEYPNMSREKAQRMYERKLRRRDKAAIRKRVPSPDNPPSTNDETDKWSYSLEKKRRTVHYIPPVGTSRQIKGSHRLTLPPDKRYGVIVKGKLPAAFRADKLAEEARAAVGHPPSAPILRHSSGRSRPESPSVRPGTVQGKLPPPGRTNSPSWPSWSSQPKSHPTGSSRPQIYHQPQHNQEHHQYDQRQQPQQQRHDPSHPSNSSLLPSNPPVPSSIRHHTPHRSALSDRPLFPTINTQGEDMIPSRQLDHLVPPTRRRTIFGQTIPADYIPPFDPQPSSSISDPRSYGVCDGYMRNTQYHLHHKGMSNQPENDVQYRPDPPYPIENYITPHEYHPQQPEPEYVYQVEPEQVVCHSDRWLREYQMSYETNNNVYPSQYSHYTPQNQYINQSSHLYPSFPNHPEVQFDPHFSPSYPGKNQTQQQQINYTPPPPLPRTNIQQDQEEKDAEIIYITPPSPMILDPHPQHSFPMNCDINQEITFRPSFSSTPLRMTQPTERNPYVLRTSESPLPPGPNGTKWDTSSLSFSLLDVAQRTCALHLNPPITQDYAGPSTSWGVVDTRDEDGEVRGDGDDRMGNKDEETEKLKEFWSRKSHLLHR